MNTPLFDCFIHQLHPLTLTWKDPRPRSKVLDLAQGFLCGEAPKTVTSALEWLDQTQEDWSADYRLFSQAQCQPQAWALPWFKQALEQLPPGTPVRIGQDDTLLPKTGKHIPGTAYARDPQSPPFQVNLIRGQRFVQASLLWQPGGSSYPWRALPLSLDYAPLFKPPRSATEEQKKILKENRKKHRLSRIALEQVSFWRRQIDLTPGGRQRLLIDVVDGSYANRTFLRGLPELTVVVARFRKDAKLRAHLPAEQRRGARKYGPDLPTPDQYRQQESLPWIPLPVFVAGQERTLHYKVVDGVCWPKVTQDRPLRLIIIKAAGYRLRKGSKLLYREPAFLITTDLTTALEELIADYLARWEIEVNFRDEKTFIGVGQAQVRHPQSVERIPQFLVACYAILLWCSILLYGDRRTAAFEPWPLWRRDEPMRPSIRDLLRLLKKEAMANAAALNQPPRPREEAQMRS
jgi:hypothetical protein